MMTATRSSSRGSWRAPSDAVLQGHQSPGAEGGDWKRGEEERMRGERTNQIGIIPRQAKPSDGPGQAKKSEEQGDRGEGKRERDIQTIL